MFPTITKSSLVFLSREMDFYFLLGMSVLVSQLFLYVVDPSVQFYWSDSRQFLFAVFEERVTKQRPFLYGYLIDFLTYGSRDLAAIVIFQILLFAMTCVFLATILRRFFYLPTPLIFIVTVTASLLPAHMIWTRYVMAETTFLFVLTSFVFLSLEFLRSGKLYVLVLVHLAGVIAIGFRWSMIPVSIAIPLVLPMLRWAHVKYAKGASHPTQATIEDRASGFAAIKLFILSVALSIVFQTSYRYSNSWFTRGTFEQPAYAYNNGLFLLGFLSPLAQKQDLPSDIDADFLWEAVEIDWNDRHQRERHRWDGRGIVRQLEYYVQYHPELNRSANSIAREIALNALARDPLEMVKLSYLTLTDFWNWPLFEKHIKYDLVIRWGPNRPRQDFVDRIKELFSYDVTKQLDTVTPLKSYFLSTQLQLALMSLSFLVVPFGLAFHRKESWIYAFLVGILLVYFNAVSIVLTSWPNARYMQSVSWLCVMFLATSASVDQRRMTLLRQKVATVWRSLAS